MEKSGTGTAFTVVCLVCFAFVPRPFAREADSAYCQLGLSCRDSNNGEIAARVNTYAAANVWAGAGSAKSDETVRLASHLIVSSIGGAA